MYDHTWCLKKVDEEDLEHVECMLDHLDEYGKSDGQRGLGDFLTAIVTGDLYGATQHADGTNQKYLVPYAGYCYNELPSHLINLVGPITRLLTETRRAKGPLNRFQIAKAGSRFRAALRDVMHEAAAAVEET